MKKLPRVDDPALIEIFEKHRGRLNSLFSFYKQRTLGLDPEVFSDCLLALLEAARLPEHREGPRVLERLVLGLYEKALEICARGFWGNRGKYPGFEEGLLTLLARFPRMVAAQPGNCCAAFCNALLNIGTELGPGLQDWVYLLAGLPARPAGLVEWQRIGLVAAWRCGLAGYREKALEYSAALKPALFTYLLGLPGMTAAGQKQLLAALDADPWLDPGEEAGETRALVKVLGGFSGFGGKFSTPPEVFRCPGGLIAFDSLQGYRITADCFGESLVPVDTEKALEQVLPPAEDLVLQKEGVVRRGDRTFPLAECYRLPAASWTSDGTTLCFTSARSHKVFVVGLSGGGGEAPDG